MTVAQVLDLSESDAELLVSSFLINRIYEKILPSLLQESSLEFDDLKAEYVASIVDELKLLYNKLGIQITEKIQESFIKLIITTLN